MTEWGTCIWGPGVRTGEDDTTETGNGCMGCNLRCRAAHHGPHTFGFRCREKEQRLHFVIRVPDASLTDINAGMSFYICQDNLFI